MWYPKASADCLDYVLDFTDILSGTGDTLTGITSATVTTAQGTSYDLTIMWSAVAGTQMVVFLASGQPNTTQRLLFEVSTVQGRVHSVAATLPITNLSPATAPPSNFPSDTLTSGKVLIAGVEALPSGYSSNGRVVMATETAAPVGTPSFESVAAETYSGDGSGLDVTAENKTQTIAEWIAALSNESGGSAGTGIDGVGIKSIEASQGAVTAGQPSTVTLTTTLTDGTTSQTTFDAPAGATGATGATGAAGENGSGGTASAAVTVANISGTYTLDGTTPCYDLTVTGNVVLALPEGIANTAQVLTVQLRQTGAFSVTLPSGCEWTNTAPQVTEISGQRVFFKFILMGTTGPWAGQVGF